MASVIACKSVLGLVEHMLENKIYVFYFNPLIPFSMNFLQSPHV